MAKRILVTGAGGFIGGFIVQAAIGKGYETWAAVRKTTNRKFLGDERIHLIELDFTDPVALKGALQRAIGENGDKWDYVVHNLGATKARNYMEFEHVNYGYTRLLVETLKALDAVPEMFLLMSSLSVMGQGDEGGYTPFRATDTPSPNTHYGMSKAKAETYLALQASWLPYTIFRCTGVYGPHERDYYLMMKSIKQGFDFSVGFKRQMLTFLYVKDLADAVMQALEAGPKRRAYFISEDRAYSQKEFREIVLKELNKAFVIPIKAPLWVLHLLCACGSLYSKFSGKATLFNRDKYNILKQRNWQCDISDTRRDLGFSPRYSLQEGIRETVAWYKAAGWL